MNGLKVLKSLISDELEKIKKLLDEAEEMQKQTASSINIRAGGSILHDFYTGIEDIFHAIANTIDETVPSGLSWHIDLLNQMTLNIEGIRSQVINKDTAKMLEEYLRFRHLFRKKYGFDLDWPTIKRLLKNLQMVYSKLENDLMKVFEGKG
jgi:hypothetical protein